MGQAASVFIKGALGPCGHQGLTSHLSHSSSRSGASVEVPSGLVWPGWCSPTRDPTCEAPASCFLCARPPPRPGDVLRPSVTLGDTVLGCLCLP